MGMRNRSWTSRTIRGFTAPVLGAAALLGACDRMEGPTEPVSSTSLDISNGRTLWVNDDAPALPPGGGCPRPDYNSIQAAVTAAAPGDRINVCPGTYVEQVTIPAGKDNLWLQSVGRWQAVIKAPPVMTADPHPVLAYSIVRVDGAHNVTLLAFTITGPGPGGCGSLHYGVRVARGGSAEILGNHIIDIRDAPPPPTLSGCQNGVAILVGRWIDQTTGSAKIRGNVIERYQKNGPTVDNFGSYAEISHNRIFGVGPTPTIAQNGSQVSRGATATIEHNFIAQNIYTGPEDAASSGIIWYAPGVVETEHNTLTANDVGINIFDYFIETSMCGTAEGSTAAYNRVRASTYDGIVLSSSTVCPVTQVQIANNHSEENAGPGIGLYNADDNTVDNNKVDENRNSGILLGDDDNSSPSSANRIGNNQVRENGTESGDRTDGIRINAGSDNNTVHHNHLRDNVTHDCHDNGAGNMWERNHGETSEPPFLCDRENDDAAFATTTVYGWDPNYPWYAGLDLVAEYDWAAAYATIDTESLLKLLPVIRTAVVGRASASPQR